MPSVKRRVSRLKLKELEVKKVCQVVKDSEGKEGVENRPLVVFTGIRAGQHRRERAKVRREHAARRYFVRKMWIFRALLILSVFIWLLMLFTSFQFGEYYTKKTKNKFFEVAREKGFSESMCPNEVNLQNSKVSDHPLEKTSTWEVLFNFFLPTTCMIKENQNITPCNELLNLTETECLKSKCCFSTSVTRNCFVPLRDKSTQVMRIFGLSVFILLFLGWMNLCCIYIWQRRMLKNLKKKKKLEDSTEVLTTTEEEDVDEEEKEAEGNIHKMAVEEQSLNEFL
ncbi:fragile X mental retardation 1 neighbor protein isoform X3 [Heterocephalus glaber]|uniref:Fragile X mental retardation 1 neighbor protein isoform X3 n=1 Tax=Heterocephalus glaber TaxID=10181 RepID=A0AAX6S7C9_HETGA|nr:fragile X mental retardation 1 neighbor protein isoform X3 [Heterocephalus glaber]